MADAPILEFGKGGRGNDESLAKVRSMQARGFDKEAIRQHLYSENFKKARVSQLLAKVFPKTAPKKKLEKEAVKAEDAASSKPILELAIDAVPVEQPAEEQEPMPMEAGALRAAGPIVDEAAAEAEAVAAVARFEENELISRQVEAILNNSPMPPNKIHMREDGNCLFRALSFVVHGSQSRYHFYRTTSVNHVRNCPDDFQEFVDQDGTLEAWGERLSKDMEFGDHISVKALAQVVSRPIVVWRQRVLNADLPRSAKVTV